MTNYKRKRYETIAEVYEDNQWKLNKLTIIIIRELEYPEIGRSQSELANGVKTNHCSNKWVATPSGFLVRLHTKDGPGLVGVDTDLSFWVELEISNSECLELLEMIDTPFHEPKEHTGATKEWNDMTKWYEQILESKINQIQHGTYKLQNFLIKILIWIEV